MEVEWPGGEEARGFNSGAIYVTEEPAVRPGMLNFAVNTTSIPPDAIKSATLLEEKVYGRMLRFLQLEIGRDPVTILCKMPFDEGSLDAARKLAHHLNGYMKALP